MKFIADIHIEIIVDNDKLEDARGIAWQMTDHYHKNIPNSFVGKIMTIDEIMNEKK